MFGLHPELRPTIQEWRSEKRPWRRRRDIFLRAAHDLQLCVTGQCEDDLCDVSCVTLWLGGPAQSSLSHESQITLSQPHTTPLCVRAYVLLLFHRVTPKLQSFPELERGLGIHVTLAQRKTNKLRHFLCFQLSARCFVNLVPGISAFSCLDSREQTFHLFWSLFNWTLGVKFPKSYVLQKNSLP